MEDWERMCDKRNTFKLRGVQRITRTSLSLFAGVHPELKDWAVDSDGTSSGSHKMEKQGEEGEWEWEMVVEEGFSSYQR